MKRLTLAILWAGMLATVGCGDSAKFMTEDRLAKGLVIILPGIEGESALNHDIRRGLIRGGVDGALPIYNWGRPIPIAGPLLNQMDFIGNRLAGGRIARMICSYQDNHPGQPVYIVGHSGGGGVAVFAAEAMPPDRKIDGLVLLSASISSGYNMTKALNNCRRGLVNFYSKADVGMLVIGTILAGNVDGIRGPAAGAVGCKKPKPNDSPEKKTAYNRLYQVEMTGAMTGGGGAHFASTGPSFVARYVAPWITGASWPDPPLARPERSGHNRGRPAKALASAVK